MYLFIEKQYKYLLSTSAYLWWLQHIVRKLEWPIWCIGKKILSQHLFLWISRYSKLQTWKRYNFCYKLLETTYQLWTFARSDEHYHLYKSVVFLLQLLRIGKGKSISFKYMHCKWIWYLSKIPRIDVQ